MDGPDRVLVSGNYKCGDKPPTMWRFVNFFLVMIAHLFFCLKFLLFSSLGMNSHPFPISFFVLELMTSELPKKGGKFLVPCRVATQCLTNGKMMILADFCCFSCVARRG